MTIAWNHNLWRINRIARNARWRWRGDSYSQFRQDRLPYGLYYAMREDGIVMGAICHGAKSTTGTGARPIRLRTWTENNAGDTGVVDSTSGSPGQNLLYASSASPYTCGVPIADFWQIHLTGTTETGSGGRFFGFETQADLWGPIGSEFVDSSTGSVIVRVMYHYHATAALNYAGSLRALDRQNTDVIIGGLTLGASARAQWAKGGTPDGATGVAAQAGLINAFGHDFVLDNNNGDLFQLHIADNAGNATLAPNDGTYMVICGTFVRNGDVDWDDSAGGFYFEQVAADSCSYIHGGRDLAGGQSPTTGGVEGYKFADDEESTAAADVATWDRDQPNICVINYAHQGETMAEIVGDLMDIVRREDKIATDIGLKHKPVFLFYDPWYAALGGGDPHGLNLANSHAMMQVAQALGERGCFYSEYLRSGGIEWDGSASNRGLENPSGVVVSDSEDFQRRIGVEDGLTNPTVNGTAYALLDGNLDDGTAARHPRSAGAAWWQGTRLWEVIKAAETPRRIA